MAVPDPAIIEEADPANSPVPLEPGLTRRFYYSLILLSSLVRVFKAQQGALRMPDLETAPADLFKTFVNKLGHICDSAKGGGKVTAFAILQLGTIRYYFTSNQRDEESYQFTARHITDILNTLGRARDDEIYSPNGSEESLLVFRRLLRMIISFNQSRIKGYICRMRNELDFCIEFARGDLSDQGRAALQRLEHLKPFLEFSRTACSDQEFMNGSQRVIQVLNWIHRPPFKEYLRLRTQNNMDRDAPWVVVSHSIGRLLSYYYAVSILISARRNWPQLFDDFEVHWVPSSVPKAQSISRKLDAAMVFGTMSNDADIISECRDYAAALEQSGIALNRAIAETARGDRFLPFVHAEVNLLDFILRLQRNSRAQGHDVPTFFLNDRYIGCSKPTCRLCELYFNHNPSGVAVRQGHRNLYCQWRAPDVFRADGDAVARERMLNIDRMIPIIRDEAFLNLRDRFATHSPNDSHDTPSNVPLLEAASVRTVDDLVSQMGEADISDMRERMAELVAWGGPLMEPSTGDEYGNVGDDDEDDGGGAVL